MDDALPVLPEPERAAFERWMSEGGRYMRAIERHGDSYKLMASAVAWNVWQAAVAADRAARWISVDERLPYQRQRVLAWDGHIVATATNYGNEWGSVIHMHKITHWQPLPEPPTPKEGQTL